MPKTTKKNLVLATIGIVLLGLLFFWLFSRSDNNQTLQDDDTGQLNNDASPEEQPDTNDPNIPDVKEESVENQSDSGSSGDNPQYIPTISRVSQDGNNVFVRAYVSTFDEGTCRLEMIKGSATFTKTSGVTPQPSYLQCSGFTVPKSELSNGTWQVKVIYQLNGIDYESESQDFNIS